jgi:tetratricopeptide (TPR) repeat protein
VDVADDGLEDMIGAPAEVLAAELEPLCDRHQYELVLELGRRVLESGAAEPAPAIAHLNLGRALVQLKRPEQALEHLNVARERFRARGEERLEIEAMDWQASAMYLVEDPGAIDVAEEALRRYRALQPRRPDVEARILEHLGTLRWQTGDYATGAAHLEAALHLPGTLHDVVRLGRLYEGLAVCATYLGDAERGVELGERALALYTIEGELNPAVGLGHLCLLQNNLASLHLERGDVERADAFAEAALRSSEQLGEPRWRTFPLLTQAEIRTRQGRLEEGYQAAAEALAVASRLGEAWAQLFAHQQMGRLHVRSGNYELAIESFRRALDLVGAARMESNRSALEAELEAALHARDGSATG